MLKTTIVTAILCGTLGLSGLVTAQPNAAPDTATTLAQNPAEGITETSLTMADGSVVTTRRETVRVIASREAVYNSAAAGKFCCPAGGIGGAIGGRDILGATPSDNLKLNVAR